MKYDHLVDEKRLDAFVQLIETIDANLPEGFVKTEEYGGIGYVVPLSMYPQGYHATPGKPLPFLNVIAQKQHIGLYHMGIYADQEFLDWFTEEYAKRVPTKLNMGKSCIRFTNVKNIPFDLIGELVKKMSPKRWMELYEKSI